MLFNVFVHLHALQVNTWQESDLVKRTALFATPNSNRQSQHKNVVQLSVDERYPHSKTLKLSGLIILVPVAVRRLQEGRTAEEATQDTALMIVT